MDLKNPKKGNSALEVVLSDTVKEIIGLPLTEDELADLRLKMGSGDDASVELVKQFVQLRFWQAAEPVRRELLDWLDCHQVETVPILEPVNWPAEPERFQLRTLTIFDFSKILFPVELTAGFLATPQTDLKEVQDLVAELQGVWRSRFPTRIELVGAVDSNGEIHELTGDWTTTSDLFELAEVMRSQLEPLAVDRRFQLTVRKLKKHTLVQDLRMSESQGPGLVVFGVY